MTRTSSGFRNFLRVVLVAAGLQALVVHADDYAPVNQLLRDGRYAEAMARADAYIARNPRDPQMRFLKGLIQQDSGDKEAAIVTYTRLIEDYPELPEPYNNVAVLYAGKGQYQRARDALEMATRTSRSYATAYENLGDVYARLATESYRQAIQLDAGNTSAAPKLALIRQLITSPAASRNTPAAVVAEPPAASASAPK